MNLLLHSCCAPCTVACAESLRAEGAGFRLFWYNPNIHPYTEYRNRRDTLVRFAAGENLDLDLADEYGLRLFLRGVTESGCAMETSVTAESASPGAETEKDAAPRRRCLFCYRLRLEKTAARAAELGCGAFSTTLLISPYQDHEAVRETGEETARRYAIPFFYRDFRPLFRDGQAKAGERGLYMQKYCGCVFSEEERYLQKSKARRSAAGAPPFRKTAGTPPPRSIAVPESRPGAAVPGSPPAAAGNKPVTVNPLFQRLSLLTGAEVLEKLAAARVMIFGLGGVGSWCAEALVRSGVGKIDIVDSDAVCVTNVNRQVQATGRTVGLSKAAALKERLLEINPDCEVTARDTVFSRENAAGFNIEGAAYVIDAIDSLTHKLDLIETARAAGVTLFSSMGMAQKMDPTRLKTADIWETQGCPLARLVRQGLRKRGFTGGFTVVYSAEQVPLHREIEVSCGSGRCLCPGKGVEWCGGRKVINGSAVTVTAGAGMILASLVLRDAAEKARAEA
ncbi:MAG: epoxyqueuosine reductase QueH [Treponema sp.]|jgi:tRNA A37 threonylcarbamoyladenosine dehydratase/predicted adenine nucleotide alpha hydrolase (AANH) superfamily ATPase|nr:epoxyqueuosine reductase QueH [Treponema sp.]